MQLTLDQGAGVGWGDLCYVIEKKRSKTSDVILMQVMFPWTVSGW